MNEDGLKLREISLEEFEADFDDIVRGYLAVRTRDLFPETALPFDVFFLFLDNTKKLLRLEPLLVNGQTYSMALHDQLASEAIDEVYVHVSGEANFLKYLNYYVQKAMASREVLNDRKTELLYDHAEIVVKKTFRDRPSRGNITMGKQLMETISTHLMAENISAEALLSLFVKDYDTFAHSVQVALLGMAFCRFLKMSKEEVFDFGLGALFHDVGKNSIDDAILNKPGSLEQSEFEVVKKHTLLGYHQLKDTQLLSRAQLSIVLHHHEAVDGSGYPQALRGNQIHLFARIARIVDCFDALTSRRVYKEAYSRSEALELMAEEMGATFDQKLFSSFKKFLFLNESTSQEAQPKRMDVELGTQIVIQFEDKGLRLKTVLVGMETGQYLIVRAPNISQIHGELREGRHLIARYIHSGIIYGFRATILSYIQRPLRLLLLSFPKAIERVNLRKDPRIECFLPVQMEIREKTCNGAIVDLSVGGCRVVMKQSESVLPEKDLSGVNVIIRTQLIGQTETDLLTGIIRNVHNDEGKYILGVQFIDLTVKVKQHIEKCVENVLSLVK